MTSFVTILLVASGAIAVLALLLYVVAPGGKVRVPAIVVSTIGGIGVGVALGMALSVLIDQTPNPDFASEPVSSSSTYPSTPPATTKDGMGPPAGGGGMGAMMKGAGGMMGGQGPNPKNQLAALVTKLDHLTGKPLAVVLDDEDRQKILEQVDTLAEMDELTAEEAQKRLDALLAILEDERPTLEAAGYRWPGGGGGGPQAPQDSPNPFKDATNAEHLRALRDDLVAEPSSP